MQQTNFITDLKRVLATGDLPVVISALRHDALMWEKLNQSDFFQQALTCADSQAELWNPASLALIALGQNIPLNTLRCLPLQPLEPELRQLAAHVYEETFRTGNSPTNLGQAGLLALALRERRRLTDTWQGLLAELQLNATRTVLSLEVWRTPIACLYAMAPDPENLLGSLLQGDAGHTDPEQRALVLHTILANPLSIDEQASRLQALLTSCSVEEQLVWLEQIQSSGETNLASQLASNILRSDPAITLIASLNGPVSISKTDDPLAPIEPSAFAQTRQQLARLYQIACRPGDSLPLLETARTALRHRQASLSLQISQSASKQKNQLTALTASEQAFHLAPDSSCARSSFAAELVRNGRTDEAVSLLKVLSRPSPFVTCQYAIGHTQRRLDVSSYFCR